MKPLRKMVAFRFQQHTLDDMDAIAAAWGNAKDYYMTWRKVTRTKVIETLIERERNAVELLARQQAAKQATAEINGVKKPVKPIKRKGKK